MQIDQPATARPAHAALLRRFGAIVSGKRSVHLHVGQHGTQQPGIRLFQFGYQGLNLMTSLFLADSHLSKYKDGYLAGDKYRSLAVDYRAKDLMPPSKEKMTELAELIRAQQVEVRGG